MLHHDDFTMTLAGLGIVLVAARLAGALFARLRQPPVIGEVLAGIALGPTLLGSYSEKLFPLSTRPLLRMLSELGLVAFMFLVGLHLDLSVLWGRRSRIATSVATMGTVVPFGLGVVLAFALSSSRGETDFTSFALFLGASMSITAFPVLARILQARGVASTPLGTVTMASAAGDDVLTWTVLALVVAIVSSSAAWVVPEVIVAGAAFALAMVYVLRPRLVRFADRPADDTALAVAFVGLLLASFVTSAIGLHEIFGAFLLGAVIPRGRLADELGAKMQPFAIILLPAFFVTAGLGVDASRIGWAGVAQLGLILLVACGGKVLGAGLAALATGTPRREALALGVLMNTRGLTELVVLTIGRDLGVLTPRLFTLLVMMAVITTVITGPLLDVIRPDPSFTLDDAPAVPAPTVTTS